MLQVLESLLALLALYCRGELELVLGFMVYYRDTQHYRYYRKTDQPLFYEKVAATDSFFSDDTNISRSALWTHPG